MKRLSFMDKLSVLLEITKSSSLYIVILIAILALGLILLSTNNKKAKGSKFIYAIIYAIIIMTLLYAYRDSLSNMMDYMMNNLFILIYFPNLAIYVAAILISNVIIWLTVFNKKVPKIIKRINVSIYCIITYILMLILNIINENKLDVFSQSSVYGNSNAQALIELSSTIFIVWILFLIVYKIIKPFIYKEPVKTKVIVKKVVKRPENYKPVEAPYQVKAVNNSIKVEPKQVETTTQTAKYNDLLTIDDYKLLLNILKEQKEKEKREKERQERIDKEQEKYKELQELYRSVR